MIEILNSGGEVLYTADDMKDVRAALQAAVKGGANLSGAHLSRAYLSRANLGGANLSRANLSHAYLGGANLSGAHLSRAYLSRAYLCRANLGGANLSRARLSGAYLSGANLSGANLSGATLSGAHLSGAYLSRAYLSGARLSGADLSHADLSGAHLGGANLSRARLSRGVWSSVASTLKIAINAMNDGGRHWIKGQLGTTLEDGSAAFCSVGALNANSEGTVRTLALWILEQVCAGSVESFNDAPDTTWEDVQAAFALAIKHAERFAKASA